MEIAKTRNSRLTGEIEITENFSYIRQSLKTLVSENKNIGREDVYREMRKAFTPDTFSKGRLYFDDVEDLIQLIKIRLKG